MKYKKLRKVYNYNSKISDSSTHFPPANRKVLIPKKKYNEQLFQQVSMPITGIDVNKSHNLDTLSIYMFHRNTEANNIANLHIYTPSSSIIIMLR